MMPREWIILLKVILMSAQASAQDVVVTVDPVELGSSATLTCIVQGGGTGTLEYQWTIGGVVRQHRSPQHTFFIREVGVNDSRSDYGCTVYDGDTALPEVMGTLYVQIPNFTLVFRESTSNPAELNYIGQNVMYLCQTLFPGHLSEDFAGQLVIAGPDNTPIGESGERIRTSETVQLSSGEYERVLYFSPLSAVDEGTYRCTSTISPRLPHPFVTNGSGDTTLRITVFPPDLSVTVSSTATRLLDIPPYNFLTLTCTSAVTVRGATVPILMEILWIQAIDTTTTTTTTIPAENFNNLGSGYSILTLNTSQTGRHTYSCLVVLNISLVTDILNRTDFATVEVIGPASPLPPENPTILSDTLSHNQSTVQWHVTMLSYDPEEYIVLYGMSEAYLSLESDTVSSGDNITRINFDLSVELIDLQPSTTYYYRVESSNSVGSTLSPLLSFTTIDLFVVPATEHLNTAESPTTKLPAVVVTSEESPIMPFTGIGVGTGGLAILIIVIILITLPTAIRCKSRKKRVYKLKDVSSNSENVPACVSSIASKIYFGSTPPCTRSTSRETVWPTSAQSKADGSSNEFSTYSDLTDSSTSRSLYGGLTFSEEEADNSLQCAK